MRKTKALIPYSIKIEAFHRYFYTPATWMECVTWAYSAADATIPDSKTTKATLMNKKREWMKELERVVQDNPRVRAQLRQAGIQIQDSQFKRPPPQYEKKL